MSKPTSNPYKPVLIFDMNETLLDLEEVRHSVSNILGGGSETVALWFETMLHYSLVDTVTDRYHNFGEIGASALMMLARNRGIDLGLEEAQQTLEPIRTVPPFPEVPAALEQLKEKGFRLHVLTNSPRAGMETQLKNAGIDRFFEQRLSVEDIGLYKPHRHVYRWGARQLKVHPEDCLFIAAHGWDIAGAMAAGMRVAFIARSGQQTYPLAPEPDWVTPDIDQLTRTLIG